MDKAKKKRIKRYVTWAGIAALVALLAVMPLLAKKEAAEDGPVASVLSAQVTRQDVPLVLRGGGTLANKGEQDVNIPTGVKITEFLVKNGQWVTAGDPVARVDTLSVMEAITGVAETMDFLREEMEENRNEKIDSQVTATAGGRVKAVFAQKGDSVQDVMLEHGALALLSIDGLMAVKLDVDTPLTTGQSVEVRLLGGSVTGRVESNLSGQIVITIDDAGYLIGDTVTVVDEDGKKIGTGELYVHNAWKAVAYSGTVDTVSAKPEQVLSSGAALFTLTDTAHKAQLSHRASQHREYEELLQKLLTMYESGYITAPCDGVVSGVDEDSVHLLSGENADAEVTLLGDFGNVQLMLLTSVTCTGKADCTAPTHNPTDPGTSVPHECITSGNLNTCPAPSSHNPDCIESCEPTDPACAATKHKAGCASLCAGDAGTSPDKCPNGKNGNHKTGCIYRCNGKGTASDVCPGTKNHYLSCMGSCKEAKKEKDVCPATGAHKDTCIRSCVRADTTGICRNGPHYVDCIQSCTGKADCPATKHTDVCPLFGMTYTAMVAKVDSVGTTELVVYWDASGVQYPVEKTASGWVITGGQFNESLLVVAGTLSTGNAQSFQKGDIVLSVTGTKNGSAAYQDVVFYKAAAPSMDAFAGMDFNMDLSGMMGGFAGYGSVSAEAMPETENLYDLKGSTLLTVTPDEGIEVEISLDERDISKVQAGMAATIKVEALRGKEFSGTVARVGTIGEHSGSTGKFTVRVEADAIPDSLPGMSSTVTIHRETREDVLTLPVAAVSQEGAKSIVYTALDSKTGKPANPQVITTGVSDGENVEVFGLEEGATVYYLYYDVLEIDHTARERQFNMN